MISAPNTLRPAFFIVPPVISSWPVTGFNLDDSFLAVLSDDSAGEESLLPIPKSITGGVQVMFSLLSCKDNLCSTSDRRAKDILGVSGSDLVPLSCRLVEDMTPFELRPDDVDRWRNEGEEMAEEMWALGGRRSRPIRRATTLGVLGERCCNGELLGRGEDGDGDLGLDVKAAFLDRNGGIWILNCNKMRSQRK